MTTPLEYANQYRSLTVALDDGPVTVAIETYHEGAWDNEADHLIDAAIEDFRNEKKKDAAYELTLTVNGKPASISEEKVLRRCLHYAFEGKGSPEDCQVGAQLAVLRKRATRANLTQYCKAHMGLDCTGFVGNYLWYVRGRRTWPDGMPGDNDGPNGMIDDIVLRGTTPVSNLTLIKPGDLHIFGLVNNFNNVVAKDSKKAHAHIVISEPGKFTPTSFVVNSFGGLGTSQGDIYGHPGLFCVESTGGYGLSDGWYALTEVIDNKTKKQVSVHSHPGYKVFRVFRGTKGVWDNFTIGALSAAA